MPFLMTGQYFEYIRKRYGDKSGYGRCDHYFVQRFDPDGFQLSD